MAGDVLAQLQRTLGTGHTVERELGGGGMSRVFVATEHRLSRKVVVKVLAPELAAGLSAERFEREIKVAASLQQANIVPVLSAGDAEGLPYYVMPFVEGESLRAALARTPQLPIPEVIRILGDVARALAYAHRHGVVHRDIKPDNVLWSGGTAVVTDFGIAKAISAARTAPGSAPTITQLGTALGTPAYMAPEQAAGDPDTDHRADIYSFGCMAYELLAGRPPFVEPTAHRLLTAHMAQVPNRVGTLRADTPPALDALVARCLAKEASARPQNADELIGALDASSQSARPVQFPRAIALYLVAFAVVASGARVAITAIGLPDWVFPGALLVMGLGLPVVLLTGYALHLRRSAAAMAGVTTPGGTSVAPTHGAMAALVLKASPLLTWRRATRGGVMAVAAFVLLVAGYMILRGLGIGPGASLQAAGQLAANERVLIADFGTTGTDSTLGVTMSEAVRVGLQQSDAITLLSRARVAETLTQMGRPRGAVVDDALAREIALRDRVKAIVAGDVAGLGSGYVVRIRLVTVDSGKVLFSAHRTADGPNELIGAVDDLTRALRGRMGESLRRVQNAAPVARATTSSLAALRKFTEAWNAGDLNGDFVRGIALLREAVAIDSTFASAWRRMSAYMFNAGYPTASSDSAVERAFRYRDRLTDAERTQVAGTYYSRGPGRDRGKAIEVWASAFAAGDSSERNNFALALLSRREYARAETLLAPIVRGSPRFIQGRTNLAGALIGQGKLVVAESLLATGMRETGIQHPFWRTGLAVIRFRRGALEAADATLDSIMQGPPNALAIAAYGAIASVRGQHRRAQSVAALNAQLRAGGIPLPTARDSFFLAMLDLSAGDAGSAVRRLDAASSTGLFDGPEADRPYLDAASAYALAGRADRARALLARRRNELRDTSLVRVGIPELHRVMGEIAITENRPRDAIAEFWRSDSLPDGPATACLGCVYAPLARAWDAAGSADSAIAYFEQYLAQNDAGIARSLPNDALFYARSLRRLGELYEAKGDTARAVTWYQKFVETWKNADPALQPQVTEVRRRLAQLRRGDER